MRARVLEDTATTVASGTNAAVSTSTNVSTNVSSTKKIQDQITTAAIAAQVALLDAPLTDVPSKEEKNTTETTLKTTANFSSNYIIKNNELVMGKMIEKGTNAEVFKARWLGKTVAVKTVHTINKEQFDHECEMLLKMQDISPNIVRYLGRVNEIPYKIVMEYVPGGDLFSFASKYHEQETHMPWPTCYRIAGEIVDVTSKMHEARYVHCDLKPENILVTAEGSIKLSDFDHTFKLKKGAKDEECRLRGTPMCLAPEAIGDGKKGKYSPASDVFSFGSILYIMAGQGSPLAYDGWTDKMIMNAVKAGTRSIISKECPDKITNLINWCWKQKPEDRPTDKELQKAVQQLSVEADKESLVNKSVNNSPKP